MKKRIYEQNLNRDNAAAIPRKFPHNAPVSFREVTPV